MARGVPVDLFARMTRERMSVQDSCLEEQRQHQDRWASLVQDPDGSWRLSAYLSFSTGKRVSISFNQMLRAHRNTDRPHVTYTGAQRRADALVNLITGEGPCARPKTTLLVIADYDTVTRELKNLRYDDALAVPPHEIARLAADAQILPAFFNTDNDPLWLGRSQRDASTGQRVMLAARDGGCVNCASAAEKCEPHHIKWFSHGGPTDINNLALLCDTCHHLTHDDHWQLQHHNGRQRLQPPKRPDAPDRTPRPPTRTRTQTHPENLMTLTHRLDTHHG